MAKFYDEEEKNQHKLLSNYRTIILYWKKCIKWLNGKIDEADKAVEVVNKQVNHAWDKNEMFTKIKAGPEFQFLPEQPKTQFQRSALYGDTD